MVTVEDYILGNSALHERFFATTEILAKIVSSAPRAVSLAQLEDATGRPTRELSRLCATLVRAELLRVDPTTSQKWLLAGEPSQVTLEDVFRCVMTLTSSRTRPTGKSAGRERAQNDVDLLVTQAMIAINQSVFMHLRQFSLDRLKISAAGMFPAPRRALRDPNLDEAFDFALPGQESAYVSPEQVAV